MTLCNRIADIADLIVKLAGALEVGFDTESSGPRLPTKKKDKLNFYRATTTGFSIAIDDESFYIPVAHTNGDNVPVSAVRKILWAVFNVPRVYGWNWKHDLLALKQLDVHLEFHEHSERLFDGMLAAYVLDRRVHPKRPFALKNHMREVLGIQQPDFVEVVGKGGRFDTLTPEQAAPYACGDALGHLKLGLKYERELEVLHLEEVFLSVEMPFLWVLRDMESAGMKINQDGLMGLKAELDHELEDIQDQWDLLFPEVDIASPTQISDQFYGSIWKTDGISKGKNGRYSTNAESLETHLVREPVGSIGHQAAELKQLYQELAKNRSTYTEAYVQLAQCMPDNRLHPNFNQHVTRTYRLSSSEPNLQNIPVRTDLGKRVRSYFIPEDGNVLVVADFSQIELRMLAHLSPEGRLAEAYRKYDDVHQMTADGLGITRSEGKTTNFQIVYGCGAKKLAKMLGIDVRKAKRIIRDWWEMYPDIAALRNRILNAARKRGYVETYLGHRRHLPDINGASDNPDTWSAERQAFNTPIQGGAADIMKMSTLELWMGLRDFASRAHQPVLVCQVHDENIVECAVDDVTAVANLMKNTMETTVKLNVPLVVEPKVLTNWGQKE